MSGMSTRQLPNATTRAAASGAWRPTAVAPTSSSRPCSSSSRVCRTTVKIPISPAPPAANTRTFQATSEPALSPNTGPLSARTEASPRTLAMSARRSGRRV